MRIGIAGIGGRVGRLLAEIVVARGHRLAGGTGRLGDIAAVAAEADIVIDFSHPDAVEAHATALAAAGVPWVLGTTGLAANARSAVEIASRRIGVVQSANFSPGIAVVAILAQRLGASLPEADYDAEILEIHHRGKRDAPSGTALELGRAVAEGRARDLANVAIPTRHGETGPRPTGGIGFAVQRGGSVIGEHVLSFIGAGERITLSHQAFDRRIFAEGALRAACWLQGKPAGRYTMADVIGADLLGLDPEPWPQT